ncbi:DUF4272 domain-containing protein [Gilliamella apis]|uniref:DUF4272 domain-containing protein n=1 Tax=Gilliamella apis TaxID=1970738 RepID=A0A2V4DPY7_9GAMM|nr:DUF4272 domain-containing protein [Gilliamella apis]PXY92689.1 DUF4272 domain-containing protein [Gilliamella apis]WLS94065.1 DUF4272 domain-containing protein [Gilliamella apis]
MSLLVNAYSTLTNPTAINFSCKKLNQRGLNSLYFTDHLNGFIGYVMQAGDGEMNSRRYELYRHIQKTKHQFTFEIEENQFNELAHWAEQANVILFIPDGTIRNPKMDVLQDPDGKFDINVKMPYPSEALQRKAKTEQYLATLGLHPLVSLPPVVAESEVILRTPDEVKKRSLALMLTGIQAESFRENAPLDPEEFKARCPLGFAALSNTEYDFIHAPQPQEQDVMNMSWRYEALLPLQWALNWQSKLPFADTFCNVSSLVETGLENSNPELSTLTLRPTSELLDALDLNYRLHWLARDCRLNNKILPVEIMEGVIQERQHALNWLTNFENADWDDVDTPS